MLNLFITSCITICAVLPLYGGQWQTTRYKNPVFANVKVENNVVYRSTPPANTKEKYYRLDLYQPENDTCTRRPLIIWMHGGGFKFGNKKSRETPLWSKGFAQRGYVCAAVNYRLSREKTLSDFAALINACSAAMDDISLAVSFFKQNHSLYGIDTTRIILAGNSAGGMIALQSVYSNATLMKQRVHPVSLPGLVSAAGNPLQIAAVINFWGSMFDTSWLKNARVPIVSVHGGKDRIVPLTKNDNGIYGSFIVHQNADALNIPNRLKVYEGYAHELQKRFNPLWAGKAARDRWQEAGQFAADFLYEELMETVQ